VAEADVIFLMDVYGKDEQADLTTDQKKALSGLADRYKHAAIEAARSFEKGTS
jgi:hypothetical protein